MGVGRNGSFWFLNGYVGMCKDGLVVVEKGLIVVVKFLGYLCSVVGCRYDVGIWGIGRRY